VAGDLLFRGEQGVAIEVDADGSGREGQIGETGLFEEKTLVRGIAREGIHPAADQVIHGETVGHQPDALHRHLAATQEGEGFSFCRQ